MGRRETGLLCQQVSNLWIVFLQVLHLCSEVRFVEIMENVCDRSDHDVSYLP